MNMQLKTMFCQSQAFPTEKKSEKILISKKARISKSGFKKAKYPVFREGCSYWKGLHQLGVRFFADSNSWIVNGAPNLRTGRLRSLESHFQAPTPLRLQNFLIRDRNFFKCGNPTSVQTPVTIDTTEIQQCLYFRNDIYKEHADSCYCRK